MLPLRRHAGYSYSGPAAAWGYKNIHPENIARVFLLGPSHHVFLRKCALSRAGKYRTPIGDLVIDQAVYDDLHATVGNAGTVGGRGGASAS